MPWSVERVPGTLVPGTLVLGTMYSASARVFWHGRVAREAPREARRRGPRECR